MELLGDTCKATAINSHIRKTQGHLYFLGLESQKLLLSSWMKLSIHLEDDIKKDVLCI